MDRRDVFGATVTAVAAATLLSIRKAEASPISSPPISLTYRGTWNAATNTPALTSSTGKNGDYYIVSTAGVTALDGNTQWVPGDMLQFAGTTWQRNTRPLRQIIPKGQIVVLWVVGSTGSDSTVDGTTFGTAFKTIQAAIDASYARYDVRGTVQLQVYGAAGITYAGFTVSGQIPGGGTFNIYGYNLAPVIDAAASTDSISITNSAVMNIAGLSVQNTGTGGGITVSGGANVFLATGLGPTWISGPCGGMKWQAKGGLILFGASYNDVGNATGHWHFPVGGTMIADSITITHIGNPAYSAYFLGMAGGVFENLGVTFSGAVTGKRFYIHYNAAARRGLVGMEAALTSYPGTINGTVERGGTVDDYGKSPSRINKAIAQTANFTLTLPFYCQIESIVISEINGFPITGGLNVGTTAGGNDVLSAYPVAANSWTAATGATILKPRISRTLDTTLYFSAVTAWNGASLDLAMNFTDMKSV